MSQSLLRSTNHLKLTRHLSDLFIDVVRQNDPMGGTLVAERLTLLRNAIWPEKKEPSSERQLVEVFKAAVKDLSTEQKTQLLEAYARMGHLHEIAGLAARHNYFERQEHDSKPIPGGIQEFIDQQLKQSTHNDVHKLTAQLSQPVFEVVMTMHPTNTNSLESMKAQREIATAIEEHDTKGLKEALAAFARAPLLHQVDGKDKNFTVRDETEVVLNYLSNIYDDLPKIYEACDKPMQKQFGSGYNPAELKLNMRFGSWGSAGDKDGNDSVTAETTLEAMALHTVAIIDRYKKDLACMEGFEDWKSKLGEASNALHNIILPQIEELRKRSDYIRKNPGASGGEHGLDLSKGFDRASKQLKAVRIALNADAFEADLLKEYKAEMQLPDDSTKESERNKPLLDLIRKVRTFGFNFAKIEYRETAKEYHRVVSKLLENDEKPYEKMTPQEQARYLTHLLEEPKPIPHTAYEAPQFAAPETPLAKLYLKYADIIDKGATKAYDKKDPMPIAYHTIKRMELARDFPDMIRDNVLAECGRIEKDDFKKQFNREPNQGDVKHTGTTNILEAQFVQRMVEKDGKRPLLGIVPLFEEPDTMKNIDNIMEGAYKNPAYRAHLAALAKDRHDGQEVQQVQIAHSDNARRSGLLAARAYIHEAHKKMRALNERVGIKIQFFEGGSISDAYRNGVRAVSASVNAFELHDFAKFTYQGGDLVNYFSAPSSNVRVFTRNIAKAAERFKLDGKEWVTKRRGGTELGGERAERRERRTPKPIIDEIAIAALKNTLNDYETEDFKQDKMGILLAALDYKGETKAGNRGSRAGSRSATAFAKVESTQEGIREGIDVEDLRTIGFSEAWQHAGIVPSWIGSQKLADHLYEAAKSKLQELQGKGELHQDEQFFIDKFQGLGNQPLTPEQIHIIYDKSPTFRDAQDRAAFALAMTDPQSLEWLEKRLKVPENQPVREKGLSYLEHVKDTYKKAGYLAQAALKGKPVGKDMRGELTESLEQLTDDIVRKTHYRDFLLYMKIKGRLFSSLQSGSKKATPEQQETIDHLRGVIHNAGDTVVHGRFPMVDDPAYGEHKVGRAKLINMEPAI